MEINNQVETIDNYLSGRMTDTEVSAFEAQLESNSELQQEVQFQKQIVSGIQQYRKAQLKAQLQAVDVSPGIGGVLQSAPAKMVYSVMTAGLIGAAAYFGFESKEEVAIPEPIVAEVQEAPVMDREEVAEPIVEEKTSEEIVKTSAPKPSKVEKESKVTEQSVAVEENKSESFAPVIDIPEEGEFETSGELITETLDTETFEASMSEVENLEVEVIKGSSGKLMYAFFDDKLSLIGDFSKSPYEILEVNSKSGKQLFLYFDTKFYALKATTEKKELVALRDKENIEKLQILRSNK